MLFCYDENVWKAFSSSSLCPRILISEKNIFVGAGSDIPQGQIYYNTVVFCFCQKAKRDY